MKKKSKHAVIDVKELICLIRVLINEVGHCGGGGEHKDPVFRSSPLPPPSALPSPLLNLLTNEQFPKGFLLQKKKKKHHI